jgi:energy-coupling factor transporter ATP-binding protein EcfA2
MNETKPKISRGSLWRKWDLHVHTPDSLVQHYGNDNEVWDKFIEALASLPAEFRVLGINDYIFLDGYKKVITAKANGKLPNIDLILPVIELRLDKFGGSKSDLSKVNYHIIFSNEIAPETIESQFLSALSSKYVLTPEYDEIRTSGKWAAVPTRHSIEDLGKLIIESVPAKERHKFKAPIIEGFNNLCLNLNAIQDILKSHYFVGKTLTAVGKTEWADIKWNDQSIADKKTIINGAELVFIASETVADWTKAQRSLTDACVNNRLVDCSDAHRFADSTNKDRLANCFTWIKADPTFEGLRQAVFEYPTRIHISEDTPLQPLLQVKGAKLSFPSNTELHREEQSDTFCFRGDFEFSFSPYLTCIIGGRGTGKSTLLNLIHEKLDPKGTEFFRDNSLMPREVTVEGSVRIDGVAEQKVVEFLQQNEIEQFASDHKRLTSAIFTRLRKLDIGAVLKEKQNSVDRAIRAVEDQIARIVSNYDLSIELAAAEKELVTQRGLVDSFQNTDYKRINEELGRSNRRLQNLKTSKERFEGLVQDLRKVLKQYEVVPVTDQSLNGVEQQIVKTIQMVQQALDSSLVEYSPNRAKAQEAIITGSIKTLRGELETFLRERGFSIENQSDVGRASERIAKLEEDIGSYRKKLEIVRTDMRGFVVERDQARLYSEAVEELLAPINAELKGLSSEVKPIELKYKFDVKGFRSEMIRYVADALGQVEGRSAREDYVDGTLKDLDFLALPERDVAAGLIPQDGKVYSTILRDFVLEGVNYELMKLKAEKVLLQVDKLGQIHVLYDDKPVENSSFGQRCTAVIVVLLLLGNMPIVIDEPEAHLDSALIAKYLVDLIKSRKNHRQIIFATHNANLVINGDAELIHCLSMDDTKITRVVSTTIEDLNHRDLLLALEGGQEAFHQREKRYGID